MIFTSPTPSLISTSRAASSQSCRVTFALA
jgi:hypothetical protein